MAYLPPALDPELWHPQQKPNISANIDPTWGCEFFHGCGQGPYGHVPLYTNGFIPNLTLNGSASFKTSPYGLGLRGSTVSSADSLTAEGALITYVPPAVFGAFVWCWYSYIAADAASSKRGYFGYGDKNAGFGHDSFSINTNNSGKLLAGWSNSGTGGRVSVDLNTAGAPLWPANQLNVGVLLYTVLGQILYINGVSSGTGTGLAGSFSGANAILGIGGNNSDQGNPDQILYCGFFRPMSFREIVYATLNPMTWLYQPGYLAAVITGAGVPIGEVGLRSFFGRFYGGLYVERPVSPHDNTTHWNQRGGFGRHSLRGRGYSK